jgi:hypothetical protein
MIILHYFFQQLAAICDVNSWSHIPHSFKKDKSWKVKESFFIEMWYIDYYNQSTNTIEMNSYLTINKLWIKSIRKAP